jgi:hypothetical protein
MSTICYSENNNSFTVEDWNTVGACGQGFFTSTVPAQCAPKKLVTFSWIRTSSVERVEQPTPAQEYREAIDSLFEHSMTKREVAFFHREKASKFVPLKPEQTRLLPPRVQ